MSPCHFYAEKRLLSRFIRLPGPPFAPVRSLLMKRCTIPFAKLDVQVLGISTDHVPCLRAWAESLGGINYPLVSDFWPHGAIAEKFGVFKDDGQSERAVFIIDKDGILRYIDVHDIHEQPDNEVLLAELKKIIPDAEEKLKHLYHEDEDLPSGGVVIYCTPPGAPAAAKPACG